MLKRPIKENETFSYVGVEARPWKEYLSLHLGNIFKQMMVEFK